MSRVLRLQRLPVAQDDETALVQSNYSVHCGDVIPSTYSIHCTADL